MNPLATSCAGLVLVMGAAGTSIGARGAPSGQTQPAETKAVQAAASSALTAEAREALELVRFAIRENDRDGARQVLREVVDGLADPRPGEEGPHVAFLRELLWLARDLGSLEQSKRVCEMLLGIRGRLLPADHPEILALENELAGTKYALGDLAGAQELLGVVLEARTRLLPADHPDLLATKENLAVIKKALGDLAGARALQEEVLDVLTRSLPGTDPSVLLAKQSLALTWRELGNLSAARDMEEEVLAAMTRFLPSDHADLLRAKQNLALTRRALGDLAGAQDLEEEVLEARTRLLPADHPDLLAAKLNLASTRYDRGDLAGAHELLEEVVEARTRLLPEDHPDRLLAKLNLAATRRALGDLAGAHEIVAEVLAVRTRLLPAGHPDLLAAKQNLALSKRDLGDLRGAQELEQEVLEERTRLLPEDHPDLLAAKQNLALSKWALGDLEGARVLLQEVLEALTRSLPADHPKLLYSEQNLAGVAWGLGDLQGARELSERVLAAWTRFLPADHPDLLDAQRNLALLCYELGELEPARELVASLLEGMRARARSLRTESARLAREAARIELRRLSDALFPSAGATPESRLDRELFATLESLRLAAVASSELAHGLAAQPGHEERARAIASARLNDLVAAGPEPGVDVEGWRRELLRLAEERDRAERELRRELPQGALVPEIDAGALGARLAPGTAAVSFLRYSRRSEDPETEAKRSRVDALLAFLVKPGGAVARIELGPAADVEELVGAWRAALGRPLAGRGIAGSVTADDDGDHLTAPGSRLRQKILDPLLAQADDVTTLHVVLDDVLYLVPLDALPLAEGLVGDRIAIRNEITLARLLRAAAPVAPGGELTLAGGLDYDAELGAGARVPLNASTPPVGGLLERSADSRSSFARLPGTTAEAESIAALYKDAFRRDATPLTGAQGTKDALFRAAPTARFLHLATHGWFAPEAFRSQLDTLAEPSSRAPWLRAQETLVGFAPETLCGLALAAANRGRDAAGRVPGILTAEELSTFDLRNCELAVLSACETNVGIRRAGQGVQSLQTALHAAGARSAITSLWRVDDDATRRLFELFYAKLWKEKLGKAEALWQAKMALRDEGHPLRDWAGWVLTGDPD